MHLRIAEIRYITRTKDQALGALTVTGGREDGEPAKEAEGEPL